MLLLQRIYCSIKLIFAAISRQNWQSSELQPSQGAKQK
jgi:hypothetical protein